MARPLRIEYDGALYHVTSRGNARKPIFKDDHDREVFLNILQRVNEKYNWLCHGYCLMNNHYHIVIETPDGNLSKGMRQLNGVYTQAFNVKHHSVGHVFQGRYKAIVIQKDSHLLEVSRYVVLNPVRAKITTSPREWKWSSYRAMSGGANMHPCLTTKWILGQFGRNRKQAQKEYREFVKAGIGQQRIWKDIKSQIALGESDFASRLMKHLNGKEGLEEIPRNQRYLNRPALDQLFHGRAAEQKRDRNRKMLEAVEKHGYSQKEIADHLGLHYTTISRLINKSELMS